MPRTRSIAWSELKVGILSVVAVALAVFFIFAVGGGGGFWWQRYPLKARFANGQGMKAGSVVRLSGKEVGTVTSVEFSGAEIEVGFELMKDVRPLGTNESRASIGSLSLLGEPIVDITASQIGSPLPDGATVPSAESAPTFADIQSQASSGLAKLDALLGDVRAGRGTLGKIVTDEALYAEMQTFVASAARVTESINAGRGTLGGLVKDPAAFTSLKASLENLQTMTARINSGQGALGKFLNDEAMGKSMSSAVANVDQITGRLNRGEGTAGKLMTDQQLYDRLNAMANRLDQVMSGLEAGRGTAGKMLHDQQLYDNMNRAVAELRDLFAEIRKDPRKYLNVRVSIF